MSTAPAAGGASRAKRLLWIAPFAIYLALAGTGITWGLPNDHSWSNDDIAPNTVLAPGAAPASKASSGKRSQLREHGGYWVTRSLLSEWHCAHAPAGPGRDRR